jgi:energy-coupling factor transporter ATP-binding protein EcfA2
MTDDAEMASPAPLRVTRRTKRYRVQSIAWLEAVSDVSFEVAAGECFGLLGPNGARKTTAIHCISRFYPATSGAVLMGQTDARETDCRAVRGSGHYGQVVEIAHGLMGRCHRRARRSREPGSGKDAPARCASVRCWSQRWTRCPLYWSTRKKAAGLTPGSLSDGTVACVYFAMQVA